MRSRVYMARIDCARLYPTPYVFNLVMSLVMIANLLSMAEYVCHSTSHVDKTLDLVCRLSMLGLKILFVDYPC